MRACNSASERVVAALRYLVPCPGWDWEKRPDPDQE